MGSYKFPRPSINAQQEVCQARRNAWSESAKVPRPAAITMEQVAP